MSNKLIFNKNKIILIIILTKLLATTFSLFIFDHFSPLVDAKLYQNEFFINDKHLRTNLIQSLVLITNFITSPFISHYIFSIFSILGILWFVHSRNAQWPVLLILFLPTSMIWTSVIGKEPIFYLGFSIILIIWSDYINNKFTLNNFFLLIFTSVICLILRPHYFILLSWLFWVAMILKKTSHYKFILLISYLFVMAMLLFIIFFGEHIDKIIERNLFDITWRAFSSIDVMGRASRHFDLGFEKYFHYYDKMPSWPDFKWYTTEVESYFKSFFGLGFIFGIIGPLPNELISRPLFTPFFIEGVIILLSPIIILFYIKINKLYISENIHCLNYIYGVFPAIILFMILHAFFGILNPGSAIRWRVNFELIFYFAPLLLYYNILDSKNKK